MRCIRLIVLSSADQLLSKKGTLSHYFSHKTVKIPHLFDNLVESSLQSIRHQQFSVSCRQLNSAGSEIGALSKMFQCACFCSALTLKPRKFVCIQELFPASTRVDSLDVSRTRKHRIHTIFLCHSRIINGYYVFTFHSGM